MWDPQTKVPRSNLPKDQRTVLKEFKGLKDEVILPAEKGNTAMMMMRVTRTGRWRCWGRAPMGS